MTDPIIPPYPADACSTRSTPAPSDDAAEVVAESPPFVAEAPEPDAPLPGIAPSGVRHAIIDLMERAAAALQMPSDLSLKETAELAEDLAEVAGALRAKLDDLPPTDERCQRCGGRREKHEKYAPTHPFVAPTPAPSTERVEAIEALPGIAPAMRRVEGGYVHEDAHPGAGEPDWRGEVAAIDAVLGNRSAFDGCATRAEKVAKAIRAATDSERWENGFRSIVTLTVGPRAEFEIPDVVAMVREALAERDSFRGDLKLARESHAGTLAMFDSLRAEVERVQGERDHMSRRLYRFRDAILRAFADTRGENALRQKIADICAPAKFASMLSTDTANTPSPAPASTGFWRCEECGEANDSQGAGPWRFNGRIWQHYCPGRHPQAGPADAKRMDAPASTGTGGEEPDDRCPSKHAGWQCARIVGHAGDHHTPLNPCCNHGMWHGNCAICEADQ